MGRGGGGCGTQRWEASPLTGSGATKRSSESSCGGRKGEMRVRVSVRPQGGSYRGIWAGSGLCGPPCFTGQADSRVGLCRPTGSSSGPSTAHSASWARHGP
jgi:hypothetical protein